MPELSRFYGIVVRMFFNDHAPPHFHAYYGSDEALFAIETLPLIAGRLSAPATRSRCGVGFSTSDRAMSAHPANEALAVRELVATESNC